MALQLADYRLTVHEKETLTECEVEIEKGLETFYKVGKALLAIRDQRLYREQYGTFEEYCQQRWSMTRWYANRLIGASGVMENLVTIVTKTPEGESQIRPLVPLQPEEQQLVWQVVQETAPEGKITAAHVKSVVNVLKEITNTGAIDPGDGIQIPLVSATTDHLKAAITEETYERMMRQSAYISEKTERKQRQRESAPIYEPSSKQPQLYVASADMLPLPDNHVDLIVTSPPYNLGHDSWPMGGNGRTPRTGGIGYYDNRDDYQQWQINCLNEMFRVTKYGGSCFYNHKVRTLDGCLIHPMDWLRFSDWTIRQEIVWDRGSTHNHSAQLFWPEDERIYWLTKGKPDLPDRPIGKSSVWREFGPVPDQSWHPAPFTEKLPEMIFEAVGKKEMVILDPFMGSGTTIRVALRYGYDAIGCDINEEYVKRNVEEFGWTSISAI